MKKVKWLFSLVIVLSLGICMGDDFEPVEEQMESTHWEYGRSIDNWSDFFIKNDGDQKEISSGQSVELVIIPAVSGIPKIYNGSSELNGITEGFDLSQEISNKKGIVIKFVGIERGRNVLTYKMLNTTTNKETPGKNKVIITVK